MDSAFWAILGAVITAVVAGIVVWLQLGAASKERLEAIYERLLSDLDSVVREMEDWDGKSDLPEAKKRKISRMLHLHLDNLVESVDLEGRSWCRRFLYTLVIGRCWYIKVGGKWFLEKHRYRRFEDWYTGTSVLYNRISGYSEYLREATHPNPNYVEEVFHPEAIARDPHDGIKSLEVYFEERLEYERGKSDE